MGCVFCDSEAIKRRTVLKDELVFAFPTNIPITPGHTLVCPNRCVPRISDLRNDELAAMVRATEQITRALKAAFGAQGFNFAWNEGQIAGQNVPHLHLHIVPRKPGDSGITEYEPRKFLYRPGSREESPEAELVKVAELIRSSLR